MSVHIHLNACIACVHSQLRLCLGCVCVWGGGGVDRWGDLRPPSPVIKSYELVRLEAHRLH